MMVQWTMDATASYVISGEEVNKNSLKPGERGFSRSKESGISDVPLRPADGASKNSDRSHMQQAHMSQE